MVHCSYKMVCKNTEYTLQLFILIQFPRRSLVSEFKDCSCSVTDFALFFKKQYCRNWKLLDVQAVTDCWPCWHLLPDRMMLHKPGQGSNWVYLAKWKKKSINLRYFQGLNRAKSSSYGMHIVWGAQVVSGEGCFHCRPLWEGEGMQHRNQASSAIWHWRMHRNCFTPL